MTQFSPSAITNTYTHTSNHAFRQESDQLHDCTPRGDGHGAMDDAADQVCWQRSIVQVGFTAVSLTLDGASYDIIVSQASNSIFFFIAGLHVSASLKQGMDSS